MEPLTFETTVESAAGGPVEVPFDVRAHFGSAKPPVRVTINGYTYRSTIAVYGGRSYVPLKRANAEAAGIVAGSPVIVRIVRDDEPRTVTVPDDLADAMASAEVRDAWDALSYSHQREHVEAIEAAKRPDTRERRIAKVVATLTTRES